MAFKHGAYYSEQATSIISPVPIDAGMPVVFGTAPVHLASEINVNKPILCNSYEEAVTALGYSEDWKKYTLCEVMYSQFSLFGYSPIIFINVLDPTKHKESTSDETIVVTDGKASINEPVILSTLKVKKASAGENLVLDVDYTATYDDNEVLQIELISEEAKELESIYCDYDKIDASLVQKEDIIGGVDVSTGALKGLELIEEIFPRTLKVPGIIIAPGWSTDSEVAAVMTAKTANINEIFNCICIVDIPTDTVTKYTDVPSYKNKNNLNDVNMFAGWPKFKLGEKQYFASTQAIGVINQTDAQLGNGVPYYSPSNQSIQADSCCLEDGTEVFLTLTQANYLNENGIFTALNFIGGWKLWGNYTAAAPDNTDVKDCWINQRRMFQYIGNTVVRTMWQKIDNPINTALVKTVLDSINIWLNGLTGTALLGARVEFLESENPTTDLLAGKMKFHIYMAAPVPNQEMDFVLEYDTSYLSTLFS